MTAIENVSDLDRTIDVEGIATHYHDVGDGPPVVLIHGSGPGVTAWANWRHTIPALAQHFRVIAPDMLGFGDTQPPDTRYSADLWTTHLLGFLDALGLDRVSLVGNSFGGAIALRVAHRHLERVDRLVLMGSVGIPFEITPGLDTAWGFEPSLAAMRELLDLFAYDRSLVTDDLARLRLAAATKPGVQEAFSAMFPAPRQHAVDALALTEAQIAEVRSETLVVHGRDDRVIPLSNSLRLLHLIPNSQLHVFGRCGHWVQIEHAAEFNAVVGEFLGTEPRTTATHLDLDEQAAALRDAARSGRAIPPITASWPDLTVEQAYSIQQAQLRTHLADGRAVVGHKIGLTAAAVQQQIGVDSADFGFLLDSMVHDGVSIDVASFLQPRVEPEIAFVLRSDLSGPGVTEADVAAATAYIVPAIEIVDSRIVNWRITLGDTIADNASSGGFVLDTTPVPLAEVDLGAVVCRLRRNGEIVATGDTATVVGSPLGAVAWLANTLGEHETTLHAGHIVLSGSLTAVHTVGSGDEIVAELTGLGTVSAHFSPHLAKDTK